MKKRSKELTKDIKSIIEKKIFPSRLHLFKEWMNAGRLLSGICGGFIDIKDQETLDEIAESTDHALGIMHIVEDNIEVHKMLVAEEEALLETIVSSIRPENMKEVKAEFNNWAKNRTNKKASRVLDTLEDMIEDLEDDDESTEMAVS